MTTDDRVANSLDAIECIMIEAMYHNNAGNIRQAWMTHRRAMSGGQMVGLHLLSPTDGLPKVLDAGTRDRIDPDYMWDRLVITDRYLSLVLGLPQCSDETPLLYSPEDPPYVPLEQLKRMASVAGGLILERNRDCIRDPEKTQEIDELLQRAEATMPPRWWLPPDIALLSGTLDDAAGETLRLMNQFTHYHLLAQLHLPYLLQPCGEDQDYSYNKTTAIMASREILLRFVSFRSSDMVTAYCRGIDFLAFIACTVVAVAHIDQHCQRRSPAKTRAGATAMSSLIHQRQSDRGLLEETFRCMELTHKTSPGGDELARKMALLLGRLLAIEAAAADGASYCSSMSPEPGRPEEPGMTEEIHGIDQTAISDELCIHIPYLGTVKIGLAGADGADREQLPPGTRSSPTIRLLSIERLHPPMEDDEGIRISRAGVIDDPGRRSQITSLDALPQSHLNSVENLGPMDETWAFLEFEPLDADNFELGMPISGSQ